MPIPYTEFNTKDIQYTGGVTGSVKAKRNDGDYYQLKPSILSNSLIRSLKAGGTDRENFGEVIASKICRPILDLGPNYDLVPDVSLSYSKDNKEISVASKYLKGNKVETLDKYAHRGLEKLSGPFNPKQHFHFVQGKHNPDKQEFSISGDDKQYLRQGIARSIAVSILVGDHDVNPGNLMVVDNKVSRIDFGHAFNDLLNTATIFGGKVRNHDNRVMDFLNRETVAHVLPSKQESKLWKSYPGIVITQDMADALREVGSSNGLQQGITTAKEEFKALLNEIKLEAQENNDTKSALKTINHIRNSIAEINNAIGAKPIPSRLTTEEYIDRAFDNLSNFCTQNQKQMLDASKLIDLQVKIDDMLTTKSAGREFPETEITAIKKQYQEITALPGIGSKDQKSITWVKTTRDEPAFQGNIDDYINYRSKQLDLNNKKLQGFLSTHFDAPKDRSDAPKDRSRFSKIIDYVFGKGQAEKGTTQNTLPQTLPVDEKFRGEAKHKIGARSNVHQGLSTESTHKLPSGEFLKKSNTQAQSETDQHHHNPSHQWRTAVPKYDNNNSARPRKTEHAVMGPHTEKYAKHSTEVTSKKAEDIINTNTQHTSHQWRTAVPKYDNNNSARPRKTEHAVMGLHTEKYAKHSTEVTSKKAEDMLNTNTQHTSHSYPILSSKKKTRKTGYSR